MERYMGIVWAAWSRLMGFWHMAHGSLASRSWALGPSLIGLGKSHCALGPSTLALGPLGARFLLYVLRVMAWPICSWI